MNVTQKPSPILTAGNGRLASNLCALLGQASIDFYVTEACEQENDMKTTPLQQRQT